MAGAKPGAPVDRLPAVAAALREAARRFGTPIFVTDEAILANARDELAAAFPDPWIRQYSVKANDVAAVVRLVTDADTTARDAATTTRRRPRRPSFGANVVSRGEWAIATAAGVPNDRITFEGVGKTDADLAAAVAASRGGNPLAWLAVESIDEVEALADRARRARLGRDGRPPVDVLVRLNPDVSPETHAGLAVGHGASKFGMSETELGAAVERVVAAAPALRARGVHVHVGSQLGAVDAWRDGVRRGLAVVGLLRGSIETFDTLDLGSGFPVPPIGQSAPPPGRFAREVPALLEAIPADRRPARLAIEPGRFLVARAGWLVGRVLHARDRDGRQVVLDTGMTELIRPALYGAHHSIVALTAAGRPVDRRSADAAPIPEVAPTAVHGPICESTDELGGHPLPPLRRGDLVAIRDAGAYGASLGSTYNGRPRPPQVILTMDGRLVLARRRGSLASLG